MSIGKPGFGIERVVGDCTSDLGDAIEHHKWSRRRIDATIEEAPDDGFFESEDLMSNGDLSKAVEEEVTARLAVWRHPIRNLEDVRAKANHARLLLAEGDELDPSELNLLFLSMI